MATFADRLLRVIAERNTSQAEVARAAGVKPSSVSDWAKGKTKADGVKAEPLLQAAAFLRVNPMWLLTGRGQREPGSPTVVIMAGEPPARYGTWPFTRLDQTLVQALPPNDLAQLEGAWIYAAKALGYSLAKPGAA